MQDLQVSLQTASTSATARYITLTLQITRIRKVKCTEERPHCRRCATAGHKCDGYEPDIVLQPNHVQNWASQHDRSHQFTPLARPLFTLPGSQEEWVALSQFNECASPALCGWAGSTFWSTLVPQISHSETSVRLAAAAIGSLFQSLGTTGAEAVSIRPGASSRHAFALQCYNKAIASLTASLTQGPLDGQIALVTCILFICIESLQGNERAALCLCETGSRILLGPTTTLDDDKGPHLVSGDLFRAPALRGEVLPIFSRLGIMSALHGHPPRLRLLYPDATTDDPFTQSAPAFESIVNARGALYTLIEKIHRVHVIGADVKWEPQRDEDTAVRLAAQQQELQSALQSWHTRFTLFRLHASGSPPSSPHERSASSILHMHYHITSIFLSTSLDRHETSFDAHADKFRSIISEATRALDSTLEDPIDNPKRLFTFEMGLIPPLYWTALKYRHPAGRRSAVSLLQRGPRQEGLWEAGLMTKIAKRVIELEEGQTYSDATVSPRGEFFSWPAEGSRVHNTAVDRGRSVVDGVRGNLVQFIRRRQDGPEGGCWDVLAEYLTA